MLKGVGTSVPLRINRFDLFYPVNCLMKKLFLLAGALLAAGLARPAQAQTLTTIGAARAAGPAYGATGSAITVTGIVTNGAELGAIRYFQDGTGGVAAYGATGNPFLTAFNNVKLGDSIVVSGTLVNYKGLLEINPITALTVGGQQQAGAGAGGLHHGQPEQRLR